MRCFLCGCAPLAGSSLLCRRLSLFRQGRRRSSFGAFSFLYHGPRTAPPGIHRLMLLSFFKLPLGILPSLLGGLALSRRLQLHPCPASFRKTDGDRLLCAARTRLALADAVHLRLHKLSGLCTRRFTFCFIPFGCFYRLFCRHKITFPSCLQSACPLAPSVTGRIIPGSFTLRLVLDPPHLPQRLVQDPFDLSIDTAKLVGSPLLERLHRRRIYS